MFFIPVGVCVGGGGGAGGGRVGCSAGSTFLTVPDMSKINSPSGK